MAKPTKHGDKWRIRIRRHLRPAFGAMRLRDLGVEEIDAYVNAKIDDEELSDKTVNNHVTLLATMLRLAMTFPFPVTSR